MSLEEMGTTNQVQILEEAVCISCSANALEKVMHPTILSQSMDEETRKLVFLTLVIVASLWEGKLWI